MTTIERITQVEQGTPYGAFRRLADRLGVSEERLRAVLGFAAATLHRRKVAGRFTLEESNRLYWLESLLDAAELVLEGPRRGQRLYDHRQPRPPAARCPSSTPAPPRGSRPSGNCLRSSTTGSSSEGLPPGSPPAQPDRRQWGRSLSHRGAAGTPQACGSCTPPRAWRWGCSRYSPTARRADP